MSATDDRAAMSTLSSSAAGRPRRDAAGAGRADECFHPLDFAFQRRAARFCQLIVAAPFVDRPRRAGSFLDEALFHQTLQRAVEGTRPHPHRAVGLPLDVLEDGVAM